MFVYAAALVLVLLFLSSAVKILNEYERGVVFRLGRVIGCKGPGLILLIPAIDKMVRVDLRVVAMDVPAQDVITRDNVTIKVSAVLYFRVIDPNRAIVGVENYLYATSQLSQTTLRSVCGQAELDELLAEREKINEHLQEILDKDTEPWGVKVAKVEIKNIDLPQEMQRAIAKQAEAERERRAKVIGSEGEFQAAQKLSDAAKIIGENPIALQLRYLQTLREVASENNSTTIFPIPIELFRPFLRGRAAKAGEALEQGDPELPALSAGDLQRCSRGATGCDPVVDDNHRAPGEVDARSAATEAARAGLNLRPLARLDTCELVGLDARQSHDLFVEDAHAVLTNRAHPQLRLERHTELAHDDHIQRSTENTGHRARHRHPTPREPEHHRIVVGKARQACRELFASILAVSKQAHRNTSRTPATCASPRGLNTVSACHQPRPEAEVPASRRRS